MSSLIVEICLVKKILPMVQESHSLDCFVVKGWTCVSGKGKYKINDPVIFLPPDSLIPQSLCEIIWPEGSAIKAPSNGRLTTQKIRKTLSQGLILDPTDPELIRRYPKLRQARVGDDISSILGITKYEPVIPPHLAGITTQRHPLLVKYQDIENIRNFPDMFEEGEMVSISEKLHGSSWHGSLMPKTSLTLWEKVKKFFGFKIPPEVVVSSSNSQLTLDGANVYSRTARLLGLDVILDEGDILYGEVVNVQKNYTYGCKPGETKFFAYDVRKEGEYLSPGRFRVYCISRGIPMVPILYEGPFFQIKVDELSQGDSTIGGQKVREGVVVKGMSGHRRVLKCHNPAYLLKDQSDYS